MYGDLTKPTLGPGDYNNLDPNGNWLKPTHNLYYSEQISAAQNPKIVLKLKNQPADFDPYQES
jgi:hypothetical protein